MLREIGQALITAFNVEKLADVLAERLLRWHCQLLCGVVRKSRAVFGARAPVLAYTNKAACCWNRAADRSLRANSRRRGAAGRSTYSFMLEPLYFREEQMVLLVRDRPARQRHLRSAARPISSALKVRCCFKRRCKLAWWQKKPIRVKTRLLTNVSHELRTPLNIILGYTRNALLPRSPTACCWLRRC